MSANQDSGTRVLEDPLTNKGTAFSEEERSELGLRGLGPTAVETLEQQVRRRYLAYRDQPTDVARHINLRALQDTNEMLFYRLVSDHIEEMLPILYTPTVGLACQRFSEIYRRPRGLFIAYPDRDSIGEILRNRPRREVDVIVVTDGQRVLGLGDQGIGGMGIPIGKLSLYTALGGIDPARALPVLLDVGTDNAELLDDPMYLGWRHRRVSGAAYDDFVHRFVQAVRAELPDVLLQGRTSPPRTPCPSWTAIVTSCSPSTMAAHVKRPIIMPLSNPTSRSEARPQDLADWTEGRALVAAGSPFPPMKIGDASIPVAQCNNVYIFPGIGLGVTAVHATRVTDAMITAAATAVGDSAPIHHDPHGTLLPDGAHLADTAAVVAAAIARAAVTDAVAPALTDDQICQAIRRARWLPGYRSSISGSRS